MIVLTHVTFHSVARGHDWTYTAPPPSHGNDSTLLFLLLEHILEHSEDDTKSLFAIIKVGHGSWVMGHGG